MRRRRGPDWKKLGIFVAAVVALAAAWRFTPLKDLITADNIRSWARVVRQTPWAPFLLVLAYTPAALLFFPRQLLTLLAILAFGLWWGLSYATGGIMFVALVLYVAGRFISKERVKRMAGT